jgi:hypothetical protein
MNISTFNSYTFESRNSGTGTRCNSGNRLCRAGKAKR